MQDSSHDIPRLFAGALRCHQTGQLGEAERLYRRVLAIDPRHADSLHMLGVVAFQVGRHEVAVEAIGRAIAIHGKNAHYHSNLGNALLGQGRLEQAIASYRAAVALQPNFFEALFNLGNALKDSGRPDEAVAAYRRAQAIRADFPGLHNNLGLALESLARLDEAAACYHEALDRHPAYAEARFNLGNLLHQQGKLDEAVACYRQALQAKPDFPPALYNLGNALLAQGRLDEAAARYRRALALDPAHPEAHNNLGRALEEQGKLAEAAACYRKALALKPDYADALRNLGNALRTQGALPEAIASYRQALALEPGSAEGWCNLGAALLDDGQLDEAVSCCRKAIALNPELPRAHNNLANALTYQGDLDEAIAVYRRAAAADPGYSSALSNLLMTLHYSERHGSADMLAEAKDFARRVEPPAAPRAFGNAPDAGRRLRIGYVSADLRSHPVGYFLSRVLAAHDHAGFEIVCYSNSPAADAVTERLKASTDRWRSLVGVSDADAHALILGDGIDVLVDLSGHTAGNRLPLFALEPAPVQATWLGYFGTTGLAAMDYILADRFVAPAGDENFFSESVWRLPDSYLCFDPPALDAPILKAASDAPVFGCFNSLAKISDGAVALWAETLARVPAALLFLKTRGLADPATRLRLERRFAAHGIDPARLILEGASPRAELLAAYDRVDVALDPLPFGGGTTTAEALWMGAPVVTLRGDRWVGRVSESILDTVDLADLVADDRDAYVRIAAALAEDRPRLARLRRDLRGMVETSPLCDGPRFAQALEAAYRGMWTAWCDGRVTGRG